MATATVTLRLTPSEFGFIMKSLEQVRDASLAVVDDKDIPAKVRHGARVRGDQASNLLRILDSGGE